MKIKDITQFMNAAVRVVSLGNRILPKLKFDRVRRALPRKDEPNDHEFGFMITTADFEDMCLTLAEEGFTGRQIAEALATGSSTSGASSLSVPNELKKITLLTGKGRVRNWTLTAEKPLCTLDGVIEMFMALTPLQMVLLIHDTNINGVAEIVGGEIKFRSGKVYPKFGS